MNFGLLWSLELVDTSTWYVIPKNVWSCVITLDGIGRREWVLTQRLTIRF